MVDAFIHERVLKGVEGGVVVQYGAVNHKVMWLMITTMNNDRFEDVNEFLECGCAIWCAECIVVLLPLLFNELFPIVQNVVGEMVVFGPFLYDVVRALHVVVV